MGSTVTDAPPEPARRVRRVDPDDQQGWGDVPVAALEHPYLRLFQVLVLVTAIILGLNQLGLLGSPTVELRTTRVTGTDPAAAAASVARASHGGGAPTVVIAGTAALADGVVATGLAGALGAPILLSDPDRLSPQTLDVVRELDVEQAYLIGGSSGLGAAIESALIDDLGVEVTRIAGTSRFDTAGLTAEVFATITDPGRIDGLRTALVVPAEDVAASLEAGSLAADRSNPLPVLISQGGVLPDPSRRAIVALGIEQLMVVGPLTGFDGPIRPITGSTGAADAAVALRDFRPPRVVVVPAGDEARSLIAGPLAGRDAGVILTADTAAQWLRTACGTISRMFVIGEATVITDTEITALENAATNCP